MTLPFTEQQFFDVFGRYNIRFWPVVALLWIVTLGFTVQLVRGRWNSAGLGLLLGFHWAWSGLVYHASYFSAVNPGAWLFATLFVVESAIFLRVAVTGRIEFLWGHTRQHKFAAALIAYSLAYPVLVLLSGHQYPRAPLFAVPCPTTLFTCGVLLTATPRAPIVASVIPVAWAIIAGTAAILLDVAPDAMLFIAGAAVGIAAVARRPGQAPPPLTLASGAKRTMSASFARAVTALLCARSHH